MRAAPGHVPRGTILRAKGSVSRDAGRNARASSIAAAIAAALLCLIPAPACGAAVNAGPEMGQERFSTVSPDSTYMLFLRDRPVPQIPRLEVDPRELSAQVLTYAERLAAFANAGIPMFVKIRESQQWKRHEWVIGHLEPLDGDYAEPMRWPADQNLCACFDIPALGSSPASAGEEICADSVFVVEAGRAIDPLRPVRLHPGGWTGRYDAILVEHPGIRYCMVYAAFPRQALLRSRVEWDDCAGIRLVRAPSSSENDARVMAR